MIKIILSLKIFNSIFQGNTSLQTPQNLTMKKINIKMLDNVVAHPFSHTEVKKVTLSLMKSNFQVSQAQSKAVYLIQN